MAKINIDENALFRQRELGDMRDITQENPSETHAKEWDLSYHTHLMADIGFVWSTAQAWPWRLWM